VLGLGDVLAHLGDRRLQVGEFLAGLLVLVEYCRRLVTRLACRVAVLLVALDVALDVCTLRLEVVQPGVQVLFLLRLDLVGEVLGDLALTLQ